MGLEGNLKSVKMRSSPGPVDSKFSAPSERPQVGQLSGLGESGGSEGSVGQEGREAVLDRGRARRPVDSLLSPHPRPPWGLWILFQKCPWNHLELGHGPCCLVGVTLDTSSLGPRFLTRDAQTYHLGLGGANVKCPAQSLAHNRCLVTANS